MGLIELALRSLQLLPEIHHLFLLLLASGALSFGPAHCSLFERVPAFFLAFGLFIGLDGGVELLFEIPAAG
jgi:hypothetical protein